MFARLGCLFVVVPLLELALLIQVGQWMGVLPTVLLVAGTGIVGAWLARSQGIRTLTQVQMQMARGELPGRPLLDAAAILVGGTLLMTPGVLTDVLGFALLLPPSRAVLKRWAIRRLERQIRSGGIRVTMMGGGMPPHPGSRPGPRSGPRPGPRPGGPDPDHQPAEGDASPPTARPNDSENDDDRPPRPGEILQ